MRGLTGKRILVAGSATGIGAATAIRLGEEGARLYLGDINEAGASATAEKIRAAGGAAEAVRFDLADPASVQQLVSGAVDHLSGLDGIANVAADLSPATLGKDVEVTEMDVAIWQHTLNANLVGFARQHLLWRVLGWRGCSPCLRGVQGRDQRPLPSYRECLRQARHPRKQREPWRRHE
jgi:NAD(P)-dependent dehydrogenase (short-subunit alcohol dehydrogenase family)